MLIPLLGCWLRQLDLGEPAGSVERWLARHRCPVGALFWVGVTPVTATYRYLPLSPARTLRLCLPGRYGATWGDTERQTAQQP